mmetsp:Transcript_23323/g.54004  ORF Transcript_23323/g.54004 Transcript_23323/m.54004 type:complete len:290 (-) Transcript_23323:31-900(-)
MSYSANGTIDECSSVSSRSRTRVSPGDPLVFRGSTIGRSGSDARGGSDLMKAYGSNSSVTYASARLCCTASSCAASASASAATAACASAAARSAAAAAAAATRCAVASRVSRCGESASEAFCAASFWPKIEWKTGEKIESSSDPVRGDMAVCCGVGPSPLTCTLIGVEGAPDAPIPGGAGLLRGEDVMKACGVAAGGLLGSLAVAAPLCSGVLFGGSPPSPSPPNSILEKELNMPLGAPGLGDIGPPSTLRSDGVDTEGGGEAAEGVGESVDAFSRGDHMPAARDRETF